MSKTLVLGTIENDFIATLSDFCTNMRTIAKVRNFYKEEIAKVEKEKEETILKREELLSNGATFEEALNATSIVEFNKAINVLQDSMKEELEPLNKARRELVKGLDLTDVYSAYVVGVNAMNFCAIGTTIVHGKKKDTTFACKKSFASQLGDWLFENGVKNAENENACRKFTDKYLMPFIGTKLDKNIADLTAYSKSQFADRLLIALKKSFVTCNFLVENEDGSLERRTK